MADSSDVESTPTAGSSEPEAKASDSSTWSWGSWDGVLSTIQQASTAAQEAVQKLELNSAISLDVAGKESEENKEGEEISIDEQVEAMATNALQAISSVWQESVGLLNQPLDVKSSESTDSNMLDATTLSILESGRGLAVQGLRMLEYVSKETIQVLAEETGIDLQTDYHPTADHPPDSSGPDSLAEQPPEDLPPSDEEDTFSHCFYIYGGPEHIDELLALRDHHVLLCTRALSKMSAAEKSLFEDQLQAVGDLMTKPLPNPNPNPNPNPGGLNPGPEPVTTSMAEGEQQEIDPAVMAVVDALLAVEEGSEGSGQERKMVLEGGIQAAKDMSAELSSLLAGLSGKDVQPGTEKHLEALRTEAVHKVSELCALSLAHLLTAVKQLRSNNIPAASAAGEGEGAEVGQQQSLGLAKAIRQLAVVFVHDIHSLLKAFFSALEEVGAKNGSGQSEELTSKSTVQEKIQALKSSLDVDFDEAIQKLHEGLQFLPHVIIAGQIKTHAITEISE